MALYLIFIAVLLLFSSLKKRNAGIFFAILVSFVFIGLRFETGLDWPIYKRTFDSLSQNFSIDSVLFQSLVTSHEVTFVALLGVMSQVLPSYEYAQAIFTLFFLLSFFKLASAVPGSRPVLALAIFFSFYLLPIGFSTVRQTFAISLFNWGLATFLLGGRWKAFVFFALAVMSQISAVLYVFGFLLGNMKIAKTFLKPKFYILISLVFMLVFPLLIELLAAAIPFIDSKISFYRDIAFSSYFGITTTLLQISVFSMGLTAALILARRNLAFDRVPPEFLRLITALSAFAIGCFFFSILRERISYEIVLLFSIFISTRKANVNLIATVAAIMIFGLAYQARTFFQYPFYLTFVPYQNGPALLLTGDTSTGLARGQLYIDIFNEQFR